ncbi:MAG: DUF3124 domain-containing protein [Desulfobacteraceae bacterium]|nr:DUF3124 domain-containing protein [Desulfobacteraceae bacterium]
MLILLMTGIFLGHGSAFSTVNLLMGQSVYVPVYSHIYHGDKETPFDLTATLSIRNTDPKQEIFLTSVEYFDSNGNFLKNYVEKTIKLKNLASIRYIIKSKDKSGGSGAKFIVRWESKEPVNPPLVEAIMISTSSQQGISFTSRGQAIKE